MIKKLLAGSTLLVLALVGYLYWCYVDAIIRVDTAEKVVALTYDDGPNPPHTAAMLEVLESQGVRATFFLKGANVAAFPAVARKIALAGHEVGNHSWHHRPMWSTSKAAMLEEVRRTSAIIEGVTGERPGLFRPPYGAQGPGLKRALAELGLPSILASTSGADWEVFDGREIADAVLSGVEPGGIILLHDGHGDVDDPGAQESRAGSVEATRIIIETLRKEGYRFVTVGEMLAL